MNETLTSEGDSREAMRGICLRITDYLVSGGMFNPELANHDAVRDLLVDAREELMRANLPAEEPTR